MRSVAMIGAGFWSRVHCEAWRKRIDVRITAICDRDRRKAAARARELGLPESAIFDDPERMFAAADADIVDIITQPDSHLELIRMAASAGKAILCQKPLAADMETAREMVEVVRQSRARCMVSENWRWLARFQALKAALESGDLGNLHSVRYRESEYFTLVEGHQHFLDQPYLRGMSRFAFFDMGAHWFDAWRFLFGEPLVVTAEFSTASPFITGEDIGVVILRHDGFTGVMDMSRASRRELLDQSMVESMAVEGRDASLFMFADGSITRVDRNGVHALQAAAPLDFAASFTRLQDHFLSCLASGEPFQTELSDNVRTLALIFAAYESARTHAPVVPEF